MKTIKKLASIALALVMVLCLTAPALAANVTIQLPEPGENTDPNASETYEAYKIFDADVAGEEGNEDNTNSTFDHVAYSIADNNHFYNTVKDFPGITLTEIAEENNVKTYNVAVGETFSAADFATALRTVVNGLSEKQKEELVVATGTATLTENATLNLENGYFLIVGSLGSKAILDTVGQKEVTITTKNDLPTIEKETPAIEGVKIGDSIPYTITVNAKPGAAKYMVHDTMGKGLTYNGDVVVTVGGTIQEDGTVTGGTTLEPSNYTVELNAPHYVKDAEGNDTDAVAYTCAFHLSFKQEYLNTITEATDIVLSYSATINDEATISVDTTTNKAKLDYGENGHTEDTEDTQTETPLYSFDLVKTTSDERGSEVLPGAEFELYSVAEGGEAIELVYVEDAENGNYYRPATAEDETTTTTINAGVATIKGLGAGTFYLEETKAPDGYNKMKTRTAVTLGPVKVTNEAGEETEVENTLVPQATIETITTTVGEGENATEVTKDIYTSGGVRVINLTGAELPSTGGIGTTIFYIAGGVLAVGAGILLVTKKRVGAKEE